MVQRLLQQLEEKQRQLEERGVTVEKALRREAGPTHTHYKVYVRKVALPTRPSLISCGCYLSSPDFTCRGGGDISDCYVGSDDGSEVKVQLGGEFTFVLSKVLYSRY